MRTVLLGFASGAALLQVQATLPGTPEAGIAIALLALALTARWPPPKLIDLAMDAAAGVLLGFCWAALLATLALAPQLAKDYEGRDLTLTGTIDSLPYHFDGGVRFNFAVEHSDEPRATVPPRIALAWYTGYRDFQQAVGDVQPGERWQLTVRLQRPHGNANPHGFDYEVWLVEQGIRATGYVRPVGAANKRIDSFVFSLSNVVEHLRATLRRRIRDALPGKEYAGVIVALVVGDQRAIEHVSLHLSR